MNPPPLDLATFERTIRVIWLALVGSLLVLPVAAYFALRGEAAPAPEAPLGSIFLGVAALLALASILIRRRAQSDAGLRATVERAPAAPSRLAGFLALQQAHWIMLLALHEAIALLGFALAFTQRDPARIWPFVLVALALDLSIFPRPAQLLSRARALTPHLGAWLLVAALLPACSFRGGDFAPLDKEPDTPCSLAAHEFCKEQLGSADIVPCVKREKYRCELLEQEQKGGPPPAQP